MTPISIKGWKKVSVCANRRMEQSTPATDGFATLGRRARRARSRHDNAETRMPCVQTGHGKSRRCNQPTSAGAESATGAAVWEMERAEPGGGEEKLRNGLTNLCKTEREMGKEWEKSKRSPIPERMNPRKAQTCECSAARTIRSCKAEYGYWSAPPQRNEKV